VIEPLILIGALFAVSTLAVVGVILVDSARQAADDAEDRQMMRLLALGDRFWADEDETDAAFCRTLEEIQALPIANPWSVL
jgi:hypothetical protein